MKNTSIGVSPTPGDQERLFTVSQFARELNRHPATIRAMLQRGTIRGFKINGSKSILIPQSQLKEILVPLVGDDE